MKSKILALLFASIFLANCSLSPGMDMKPNSTWLEATKDYVYIDENRRILIEEVDSSFIAGNVRQAEYYKIGVGDKLAITVWGLPEIFPMASMATDQSLRIVGSEGTIFFPYIGSIKALGKTKEELRKEMTEKLAIFFTDPQLDVSIAKFESQRVYILGEVTRPKKLVITETPLSLSDALGQVSGLSTSTSAADGVYIVRQESDNHNERIFRVDMSSPSSFLIANSFYLESKDIVYVNAKGTTRWNRVISQFFPFSSFLNSIDNLLED